MAKAKKIPSLLFAACVLQWFVLVTEAAISIEARNSKPSYAGADDKEGIISSVYHKSRQPRCVTCYENRRYGDDRRGYYGSYATKASEDRWSYPTYDRYDDRGYRRPEYDRYGVAGADRYRTDRYGADKYGTFDRYGGYRDDYYATRPYYDRYDTRTRGSYEQPTAYDRGQIRGYGYDRYYGNDRVSGDYYGRDRYYDRSRYGATDSTASRAGYGSYDRDYYDRYTPRYDSRYNRPWDDTYRRQTELENVGRGYSYAQTTQDRRYLPEPDYNPPASTLCGIRKPNCVYNSEEGGTRVTSDTINSGHYNVGVSQTTYNTNPNTNENESSKGSGLSAGWSYVREDEQPSREGGVSGSYASSSSSNKKNSSRNSDQQSSGYGALLDRGSNLIAVEPDKSHETIKDSMASNDVQSVKNGDETLPQSNFEQNSE